jgi:NADH-quinone oxidoreductase subunit M
MSALNALLAPWILPLSVAFPLLAAVLIATTLRGRAVTLAAFAGFAAPVFCALHIWFWLPDLSNGAYANTHVFDIGLAFVGIHLSFGINGISLPLYLLAALVGLAAGLHAIRLNDNRPRPYLALLLTLQAGLLGAFSTTDIFFIYFFHEIALIPTFILITLYGGRDRSYAATKLAIYLTFGALISLVGLIALQQKSGADSFNIIELQRHILDNGLALSAQKHITALLLIGFGILVSLWPLHTWAVPAYTAAPTPVSMLHAGVLKKFGLYALVQIIFPVIPEGLKTWTLPLAVLAVAGNLLVTGFVTIAQTDLKRMIATSSVMHMGYAFLAIAACNTLGAAAAVLFMVAHGLSVALLFLLSNNIHQRTGTSDMSRMGGLARQAPLLATFFAAATFASIGLPGFAGFWGEILVFTAAWPFSHSLTILSVLGIIISATYALRALAKIFFGPSTSTTTASKITDLAWPEKLPALILLIALIVIGFYPRLLTAPLDETLPDTPPHQTIKP